MRSTQGPCLPMTLRVIREGVAVGRRRAVELVAWPLLALAAALCVGWACAAVSEGVLGVFRPSEDRDLEGLGVVILFPARLFPPPAVAAWVGGVVLGGLTWVLVLILGARRVFPERRRGVPVLLCAVLALAAVMVGFRVLAGAVVPDFPATSSVLAMIAGSMLGAGLVFPLWAALPYVRRAEARSGRVPTDGLAVLDSWKRQP